MKTHPKLCSVVFASIVVCLLLGAAAVPLRDTCTDGDRDGVCDDVACDDGVCDEHDNCPDTANPNQGTPIKLNRNVRIVDLRPPLGRTREVRKGTFRFSLQFF